VVWCGVVWCGVLHVHKSTFCVFLCVCGAEWCSAVWSVARARVFHVCVTVAAETHVCVSVAVVTHSEITCLCCS